MNRYKENLNDEMKEYLQILCSDFPEDIYRYLEVPELKRIDGIGVFCGSDYTNEKLGYRPKYFYSRLDHSIAVAHIIWNFTKDKKQTLSALFHDISTPVFSHVIDCIKGDNLKQEFTESYTAKIMENSEQLKRLLEQDKIKISEINNCKMYPLVDSNRPKLCADRIDAFLFTSKLIWANTWNLADIEEIYNNIVLVKNEEGQEEFALKDTYIALKFMKGALDIGYNQINNNVNNKLFIKFLGDIVNIMYDENLLDDNNIFYYTESQAINLIETNGSNKLKKAWNCFKEISDIKTARNIDEVGNNYYSDILLKKRYMNPLVLTEDKLERLTKINTEMDTKLNNFLEQSEENISYIDFKL